MLNNPYFKVKFTDKTYYRGYSFKGDWNHMPSKPIESMIYNIGTKRIILRGYKEYNHAFETVTGLFSGKSAVSRILLMARKDKICDIFEINFKKSKLWKYEKNIGEEYNVPVNGWHAGQFNNPSFFYERC